jgi:hypothetical protein
MMPHDSLQHRMARMQPCVSRPIAFTDLNSATGGEP